jgi:hypothetical protein
MKAVWIDSVGAHWNVRVTAKIGNLYRIVGEETIKGFTCLLPADELVMF